MSDDGAPDEAGEQETPDVVVGPSGSEGEPEIAATSTTLGSFIADHPNLAPPDDDAPAAPVSDANLGLANALLATPTPDSPDAPAPASTPGTQLYFVPGPYTFPDGATTIEVPFGASVTTMDNDRVAVSFPDGSQVIGQWVTQPDGTRDYDTTTIPAGGQGGTSGGNPAPVALPPSPPPTVGPGVTVTPIGQPVSPLPPEVQQQLTPFQPSPAAAPTPPPPPTPQAPPWIPPVITVGPTWEPPPPGTGDWVYNYPTTRQPPVPWQLGNDPRGRLAEPILRDHFYAPLGAEPLPHNTPAADLHYGGTRTPIEGTQRLTVAGQDKKQLVPYVGWRITGGGVISLKTDDLTTSGKAKPDAVYKQVMQYADALANKKIEQTDIEREPGVPRNRIEIADPTERILHLQLNGSPDEAQADQLERARIAAATIGVEVVILGPPSVATSITTTGVPSPTYISTTPPLTPGPELERGQAKAQASVLAGAAVAGVVNDYAGKVQKADAEAEMRDALARAAQAQQADPHTGVSIWTLWHKPDVSPNSFSQPGAAFVAVVVVPEREPSPLLDTSATAGSFTSTRVWLPPPDPSPATPPTPQAAADRISATSAMIDRAQRSADAYQAENFLERAWNDRIGQLDTSQLEQARADLWNARQAAAEGRYSDAEEAIYTAREELRAAQDAITSYRGNGSKL